MYGGRAAEVRLRGSVEKATAGASADIQQATKIASSYVSICEGIDYSMFGEIGIKKVMDLTQDLLKETWKESQNIIDKYWIYVDAIAKELMKSEFISNKDFLEIVQNIENSQKEVENRCLI